MRNSFYFYENSIFYVFSIPTGSQGDDDGPMLNKQLNENVNKLNIVNGNRTYRIPSPTNKTHSRPSGQYPFTMDESKNGRGFYVSFSPDDDEDGENGPRFTERNVIKPPFRAKRLSAAAKVRNLRIMNYTYRFD